MVELRVGLAAVCESLAEMKQQLQRVSSPITNTESSQRKPANFKKKLDEIHSKQDPVHHILEVIGYVEQWTVGSYSTL